MKHGYTNETVRQGATVKKAYAGPDAHARQTAELRALESLSGCFPLPRVSATGRGWITTEFVDGAHGQDLITSGDAQLVLSECGRVLRQLHALDPREIHPSAQEGSVIQHGDFGPNNMLLDTSTGHVVAVLDWEFSGTGEAIADIAWCEWIIRMHHPESVPELPAFFDAYGSTPPWSARQAEMVQRCRWLEDFTRRWDPSGAGATTWQQRTRIVESWSE